MPARSFEQLLSEMPWRQKPEAAPTQPTVQPAAAPAGQPTAPPTSSPSAPPVGSAPGFATSPLVDQIREALASRYVGQLRPGPALGETAAAGIAGGHAGIMDLRKQRLLEQESARQFAGQEMEAAGTRATLDYNRGKLMYDRAKAANERVTKAIDRFTGNEDEKAALTLMWSDYLQKRGKDDDDIADYDIEGLIGGFYAQNRLSGAFRGPPEEAPDLRKVPAIGPDGQQLIGPDGRPLFDYQEHDPYSGTYRTIARGRSGEGGVNIINEKGPQAFSTALATAVGERAAALLSNRSEVLGRRGTLQRLEALVNRVPKQMFGELPNNPVVRFFLSGLANQLGIDPGSLATVEDAENAINQLKLESREQLKGQGTISDFEGRILGGTLPGLATMPEATIAIIHFLMEANEREIKKSEDYARAISMNPEIARNEVAFIKWENEWLAQQPWADPNYVSPTLQAVMGNIQLESQVQAPAPVAAPSLEGQSAEGAPENQVIYDESGMALQARRGPGGALVWYKM